MFGRLMGWVENRLTAASTCSTCLHQSYTWDCDCKTEDCVCFQERPVQQIQCLVCSWVPELDEPGIYAQFGNEALQYRREWQNHVESLHLKFRGEMCAFPNWQVIYY